MPISSPDPPTILLPQPQCDLTQSVYIFGEKIEETIFKNFDLSIVESGRAEICQESVCFHKYHAFRPIRILEQGDSFGVFEAANRLCKIEGKARHKEDWSVYSGNRSAILIGDFNREKLAQYLDPHGELSKPDHRKLRDSLLQHDILRTCYGKLGLSVAHQKGLSDEFLNGQELEILRMAWRGCYPYIRGMNYYNRGFYDKFIVEVMQDEGIARVYGSLTGISSKGHLFPAIISAIVEALERPLYSDPMFVQSPIENAFQAGYPGKGDSFIYPVGFENYLINQFVEHWYRKTSTQSKVETVLSPEKQGNNYLAKIVEVTFKTFSQYYHDHYKTPYPYHVIYEFKTGYSGRSVPFMRFSDI